MIEIISSVLFTKPLTTILFIFSSPQEWILVIVAVFLLFGTSRLPQLAKSIGQTRKAFKDGLREAEEEELLEQQQKQINQVPTITSTTANAALPPQITNMSDEELMAEMRRRVQDKQQ